MITKTQVVCSSLSLKFDLRWIVWVDFVFLIPFLSQANLVTGRELTLPPMCSDLGPNTNWAVSGSVVLGGRYSSWRWMGNADSVGWRQSSQKVNKERKNVPSPTFCPLSPHPHTLPYIWKGFCLSFLLFSGHSCLFLSTRSSRSSRTTLMIFSVMQCQAYKPGLYSEMEMNLHEVSVQRRVAQLPGRPL